MAFKLGIAPINWSNDDDPSLGKDISFEQCIREMAEAGYTGTEMGNKYPKDAAILKSALNRLGLEMASAWFSTYFTEEERYEETLSRFLNHLSLLRALGARFINVCECGHAIQNTELPILGSQKPVFNSKQWQQLIQGLHALGRIANDYKMTLVYHYHAGTGVFYQEEIDYLMAHSSPELLFLLLDTGHAAFAGIDSLHLLRQYKQRIQHVHLKDIRKAILAQTKEQEWGFMDAVRAGVFTVPGDGMINFAPILEELKNLSYQNWLIVEAEQDPAKAPPSEYAQKAYRYLSELI